MARISWFLVCTIFNLFWGNHSQGTKKKDCKRVRGSSNKSLKYSYININNQVMSRYKYLCQDFLSVYTLWLIDTFKNIKLAWSVLGAAATQNV